MGLKNLLKSLKPYIFEFLYPKGITCNFCGKELDEKDKYFSICESCDKLLVSVNENPVDYGDISVFSCFYYGELSRKIILQYKESDKPYLCEYIAKYIYEFYKFSDIEADCVCYVPTSPRNIKRRGYDGMKIIAEEFSRLSDIPLNDCLFRKDGCDQTEVAHEERAKNVKDKFLSRKGFDGTVLLLDDVVTTGATLTSCAKTILSHGAEKVVSFTFARAGGPTKHEVLHQYIPIFSK